MVGISSQKTQRYDIHTFTKSGMKFRASIKEILEKNYPGCESIADALAYTVARIKNNEPLPPQNEISNETLWKAYREKVGASLGPSTPTPQTKPISNPGERRKLSLPYKDDSDDDRPDIPF